MSTPTEAPDRTQQSPIKLVTAAAYYAPELKPPAFKYAEVRGALAGHDFIPDPGEPACTCEFQGLTCPLLKLHFHAPSEHHIDDKPADLEVHFVHKLPPDTDPYASVYLVVGVLLTVVPAPNCATGTPLSLDNWLARHFADTTCDAPQTLRIDPNIFLPADRAYFRYEGSLTTGDCEEVVSWVVLRDRHTILDGAPIEPEEHRRLQSPRRRFVLRSFALPEPPAT